MLWIRSNFFKYKTKYLGIANIFSNKKIKRLKIDLM